MNKVLSKDEVIALYREIVGEFNTLNFHRNYSLDVNFSTAVGVTRDGYSFKGIDSYELVAWEGGEGCGENAYHVIKWKGTYYRFDYSYHSYDGFNYSWATVYKVEPKEKTITVYE